MSAQAKSCTGLKNYDELKKKVGSFQKPKVEEVTIENCKAAALSTGLFQGYAVLVSLYISGNEIETVASGTFAGLPNLKYLYLNNNNIQNLESQVFKGLNKLSELDVSCNKLTRLVDGVFQSFATVANGATVNVSNNQIVEIEEGALKSLTVLNGTFDLSNNRIEKLKTSVFANILVDNLDLSNNQITEIEENAFELSNVKFLHVERNKISEIHPEAFNKLEIQSELHACSNQIKLYKGMFRHLRTLRELHLHDNCITDVPDDSFEGLSDLDTLYLNKNEVVLSKNTFKHIENLEYLHLEDCSLGELEAGTLTHLKNLRNLNLSYNNFETLTPNMFWEASCENEKTYMFTLSLQHNQISEIEPGAFDGVDRIENLQLYGNFIDELDDDSFRDLSFVGLMNLQNNKIETHETLKLLPPCGQVQLGGNPIQSSGFKPQDKGLEHLQMISFNYTCYRYADEKWKLDENFKEMIVAEP